MRHISQAEHSCRPEGSEVKMPRWVPTLAVAAVSATLVSLSVGLSSATAAAPGNDTIGGATTVAPGFTEELDTSEATTDAEDAAINSNCGAPATDASVWYAYQPRAMAG